MSDPLGVLDREVREVPGVGVRVEEVPEGNGEGIPYVFVPACRRAYCNEVGEWQAERFSFDYGQTGVREDIDSSTSIDHSTEPRRWG